VRDAVEVKLFAEAGELYVLAKSEGRRAKERAMRPEETSAAVAQVAGHAAEWSTPDQLLLRMGAARKEAGSVIVFSKSRSRAKAKR